MAKKRKYGEGLLRKRSDGRWEARVVIGYDENNLPRTKNVTAVNKEKCLEKIRETKTRNWYSSAQQYKGRYDFR